MLLSISGGFTGTLGVPGVLGGIGLGAGLGKVANSPNG